MIEFGARNGPRNGSLSLRPAAEHLSCGTIFADDLRKITRHTLPSNLRANSLKKSDDCPHEVTHKTSCQLPNCRPRPASILASRAPHASTLAPRPGFLPDTGCRV